MHKPGDNVIESIGIVRPEELPKHPIWFTDFDTYDTLQLPQEKPPIKELLSIAVEPEIRSTTITPTTESVSFEGQMLESNNLILETVIKLRIKYLTDTSAQSIHIACFDSIIRSICIVLPAQHIDRILENSYDMSQLHDEGKIIVRSYIEDIYGAIINSRTLFVSTALFIDATLQRLH